MIQEMGYRNATVDLGFLQLVLTEKPRVLTQPASLQNGLAFDRYSLVVLFPRPFSTR